MVGHKVMESKVSRPLFSLVIVAGDMICFVVGNKLGSAGVSIKFSEKGSVKQTRTGWTHEVTTEITGDNFGL